MTQEWVSVISDGEKSAARREKRVLFLTWLGIFAAYLILVGVLIGVSVYRVNVFRDRSLKGLTTAAAIIASVITAVYSMFFFSIKYRLTRKYVKMLRDMETGLKDASYVKFLEFDRAEVMKDGVFFYTMVVDARPLKREDITRRSVLVEHTVTMPELVPGQALRIITHANILTEYKLIPNKEDVAV
ncbi:MAG: hypothetical protein LBP26_00650 [Clostridiales bacterium]|jgi:hypothetical protein|nr:hypothetical protein [Clostridiales bacterium]